MVKGNRAGEVVVAVVAVVLFALAVDQTRFDVSRARKVHKKTKPKKGCPPTFMRTTGP